MGWKWRARKLISNKAKTVANSKWEAVGAAAPPLLAQNFLSRLFLYKRHAEADQGICERKGGTSRPFPLPSLPFPLHPFPSPLEVGPLNQLEGLGERCKLPQWGLGQSPGRKRIRCTLELPESHWCQSFGIFWVPCFTVERSKFSIC